MQLCFRAQLRWRHAHTECAPWRGVQRPGPSGPEACAAKDGRRGARGRRVTQPRAGTRVDTMPGRVASSEAEPSAGRLPTAGDAPPSDDGPDTPPAATGHAESADAPAPQPATAEGEATGAVRGAAPDRHVPLEMASCSEGIAETQGPSVSRLTPSSRAVPHRSPRLAAWTPAT